MKRTYDVFTRTTRVCIVPITIYVVSLSRVSRSTNKHEIFEVLKVSCNELSKSNSEIMQQFPQCVWFQFEWEWIGENEKKHLQVQVVLDRRSLVNCSGRWGEQQTASDVAVPLVNTVVCNTQLNRWIVLMDEIQTNDCVKFSVKVTEDFFSLRFLIVGGITTHQLDKLLHNQLKKNK
jgi:hypothetical protein